MTASVRPEAPTDTPGIRALLLRSFATQPGVADMVDAVRASPQVEPGLALVADVDGLAVGPVMLSRAAVLDDAGTRGDVLTLSRSRSIRPTSAAGSAPRRRRRPPSPARCWPSRWPGEPVHPCTPTLSDAEGRPSMWRTALRAGAD